MTKPDSSARGNDVVEGERLGQLIRLKPEYRERYVALHAHPFPELIETSNQHNYSIFLRDDLLFAFFEYVGSDFEADMERLADTQVTQDWWTLTDPMQESLPERDSNEWWASMEGLYHGGPKSIPSRETEKRAFFSQVREGAAEQVRRTYGSAREDLDDAVEAAPVQYYTVYLLGNRLCTYLECTDDDGATALDQFREMEAIRGLHETLDPLLVNLASNSGETKRRPEMELVFYMA